MKYALLIYQNEKNWASASPDEVSATYAAHGRFAEMLGEAARGGEQLALTETATTVRAGLVTDGPYAETAEQLGGFYLVEAADLDEALTYARELARMGDVIEVRPIVEAP